MGARVVVIDNYDSFVYNLVQYLGELGAEPEVYRHDEIDLAGLAALNPDGLVISPGPGRPEDAGISSAAIKSLGEAGTPVLGVCLGHQCIGALYGGSIERAPRVMHGKTSEIIHDPFVATRYHSLVVERDSVPDVLRITAETEDGLVMGLRHVEFPIEGVQFHPEAILTESGRPLIANFLSEIAAGQS